MAPPLPPTQMGFALSPLGRKIVIEMFIDMPCVFSGKMLKTVQDGVLPKFGDSVTFIVHHVPQPWHPHRAWVHEVCMCIGLEFPDKYGAFVRLVVEAFESGRFKDISTFEQTRGQVYEELFALAGKLDGVDVAKLRQMLTLKEDNTGNEITQRIKWACKFHRSRGVHVSPTVYVN